MSALKAFQSKDLFEQLEILEDIKSRGDLSALEALYELFTTPLGDDAIDYMVQMTLLDLLSTSETEAIAGLTHDHPAIQKLCISVCRENRFTKAVQPLVDLVNDPASTPLTHDLFLAMSSIMAPEFLAVFRKGIDHEREDIAAMSIAMLGQYNDEASLDALIRIVEAGETDAAYKVCSLKTAAAIEALGRMTAEKAAAFLVAKMHYRNPGGRMLVYKAIVEKGMGCLPFIEQMLHGGDGDMKIMAANILGDIGDKTCGELLIAAADQGIVDDPNVKYALYEALGKIDFMKGMVFLTDGLQEQDPLLLTAVIQSLRKRVYPGLAHKMGEVLKTDARQGERVLQTIVATQAEELFELLYKDGTWKKQLIDYVMAAKDQAALNAFRVCLDEMGQDDARKDAARLESVQLQSFDRKSLAVDDSKAMLAFYRSILSQYNMETQTVENGVEALEMTEKGEEFDVILTDMNMPVMDGIELTRQLRANPHYKTTPILMITTESEKSQARLAKEAGVSGFLSKPFTEERLIGKIKALAPI